MRNRDRGAVLVETAFMLPLILLLVFGIIEFSLAFQSSATLADATRVAGRAAAKVGHTEDFETVVANAASATVSNLPKEATPRYLLIYEPNASGLPGDLEDGFPNLGQVVSCGGIGAEKCWVMEWDAASRSFEPVTGTVWPYTEHDVCTPPYGRIGIAVIAEYAPLTGLFDPLLRRTAKAGNWNPMTDIAIFNFDPNVDIECDAE